MLNLPSPLGTHISFDKITRVPCDIHHIHRPSFHQSGADGNIQDASYQFNAFSLAQSGVCFVHFCDNFWDLDSNAARSPQPPLSVGRPKFLLVLVRRLGPRYFWWPHGMPIISTSPVSGPRTGWLCSIDGASMDTNKSQFHKESSYRVCGR